MERVHSYNNFKTTTHSLKGRSFGSKCLSRKVSPKTEHLRNEEPRSQSESSRESNDARNINHKEIIIENLNSFSDKSNDSIDDKTKYLNTSTNNEFKMTYLSDKYRDFDNLQDKMLYQRNFSDVNFMKRNSTVKELRKQQLIENKIRPIQEHACNGEKIKNNKSKSRKGKRKNKRSKRFRDLSIGNQIIYKGKRGYALIKKYHEKRRNESSNYRSGSLGPAGFKGSVRSRNKSSEGFFSSIQSCSSDCNSISKSKSTKRSKAGFFTRNKLNEKHKAITEAKRMKLQNTLNKVMKIHACHVEPNHLSRKSSNGLCESVHLTNQSSNNRAQCKCCMGSSATISHQLSSERNFNFDTPKISISDQEFVQFSRNYETNRGYDASPDHIRVGNFKSCGYNTHGYNSKGKVSPKSISDRSKQYAGCRTQKPSFIESKHEMEIKESRCFEISKQISDALPLHPVLETEDFANKAIKPVSRRMLSNKIATMHTASSSVNNNGMLF